jgi:uncharacterized membrane protein YvbJ
MTVAMVAKFKLILAGIGAFLVLLVTVFFKGRSSGVAATESKVQDIKDAVKVSEQNAIVQVAKKKEDNAKVKSDVQKEAIANSDSSVDAALSERWTRD